MDFTFLCRFRHKWKDTERRTVFGKDPIYICERCKCGKYISLSGLHMPIPAKQLELYLSQPKVKR